MRARNGADATNCCTFSIADQRLNNQTIEALNGVLQVATKIGLYIG